MTFRFIISSISCEQNNFNPSYKLKLALNEYRKLFMSFTITFLEMKVCIDKIKSHSFQYTK